MNTLVTGASRGIGRAIVESLSANGRSVIASARDLKLLHELGPHVIVEPADLSQPGAAADLVSRALTHGPLHEVVMAAGIVRYAPFADVSEAELRAQMELNFFAPFALMQAAGARLVDGGSMVVIASTLGFRNAPTTAAYAASKAALISAARSCALELAPRVRVNVIAPGIVDTDMIRVARRRPQPGEEEASVIAVQVESLRTLHPMGRLGSPEDIAQAVLYCLEARWLTGSVLTIDGGLTVT